MKKTIWTLPLCVALIACSGNKVVTEKKDLSAAAQQCRDQAKYEYDFDMMKIEGEEIGNKISHQEASEKKRARHDEHVKALEDCGAIE